MARGSDDADEPSLAPGTILDGRYRLERRLGKGGMGTVYAAQDAALARTIALKLLSKRHAADERAVERFRREARQASQAHHPHIVEVLALGQTNGQWYLTMELLDGLDLSDAIALQGCYEPRDLPPLLDPVLRALEHAHGLGLVHRDLKPENIFLARAADDELIVKLLDFGLVQVPDGGAQQQLTRTGIVVGTPAYMAPEQAIGAPVDGRADLYALGCVAYAMLCGEPPFTDASVVRLLNAQVTQAPKPPSQRRVALLHAAVVDRFILRALEKAPERRFQSASEMRSALAELAAAVGEPEAAQRRLTLPPSSRTPATPLSLPTPEGQPVELARTLANAGPPVTPASPTPLDLAAPATTTPTQLAERPTPVSLVPSAARVSPLGIALSALFGATVAAIVVWLCLRGK